MGGKITDLTGKRFGRLLVAECKQEINASRKRTLWLCKCDCGNKKWILAYSLTSGHSTSCGCYKVDYARTIASQHRAYNAGDINGTHLNMIKQGAKSRKLEYNISDEYLWELFVKQNKRCALSGVELSFSKKINNTTASLDRIDSSKGYVDGNLQWIHRDINKMKNNLPENRFLYWCELISKYKDKNDKNVY